MTIYVGRVMYIDNDIYYLLLGDVSKYPIYIQIWNSPM